MAKHFGFGDPYPDKVDESIEKSTLLRLLELVEDNLRTSASKTGLERRSENNSRLQYILCRELGITEEEAEKIYWKYIERLGE